MDAWKFILFENVNKILRFLSYNQIASIQIYNEGIF